MEELRGTTVDIDIDCMGFEEEEQEEELCLMEPARALMCCLDDCGGVDIERIGALTGMTPREAAQALRGAIIRNPEGWEGDFTQGFELYDAYVSGNLAQKLSVARKMNKKYNGLFDDNVDALKKAMPSAGRSKKFKAMLGAPWIPPYVIDEFIEYLLGKCKRGKKCTFYDPVSGMWEIPYEKEYSDNVRNINTYGTEEMPAVKLIKKTLNSMTVTVTRDEPARTGSRPVIDHRKTELALEHQKIINEKFADWVMADPNRAAELRDVYETTFCTIASRKYDGSFLTFPGMNPEITLRRNQRNAVARIVFSNNTLLAHDVGTGKTYTMIAAGHEIRRMGISKKNMYVVPNNILAQWESDFEKLYPEDRVLVVCSKTFGPDKRQQVLSLIRDGDYDAILIAASSFSLIPMTIQSRIDSLARERAELTQALISDQKLMRKRVMKKVDCINEEIEKLREKQRENELSGVGEGICFDHLGITTLFVDEAHDYKNITVKTKSRAVYGIVRKGSSKCDNMLAKVRFTQQYGRGAVLATATPISNSITDVFSMQCFLQGGELKFLDLASFDNWSSTFAAKEEMLEIDVDCNSVKPVLRLCRFHNLTELSSLFTQVADFYFESEEGENRRFNSHDIKVTCPPELRHFLRQLSERAEKVRAGDVPRYLDNLLKITADGRKAALDIRLIEGFTCSYKAVKAFRCAEKVYEIWKNTADRKLTQLVFCDLSTPKKGFNIYDELRFRLVQMGVPSKEIAFIHDAETNAQKRELFDAVNNGRVRVLIGSTPKLGTGVNVQRLLCAIHHLDVPWRPSELVQRRGRIDRTGNECETIDEYNYVTKSSYDAVSWQILQRKQDFIAQFMTNTLAPEVSCDFEEMALTFAEIKALAVGDPLLRRRIETQNDLNRMLSLQRAYMEQRRRAENEYMEMPGRIVRQHDACEILAADAATVAMECELMDKEERRALGEELLEALGDNVMRDSDRVFFSFMGLDIILPANMLEEEPRVILEGRKRYIVPMGSDIFGNVRRLENAAKGIADRARDAREVLTHMSEQLRELAREVNRENPYEEKIIQLRTKLADIDEEMRLRPASGDTW